MDAFLFLSTGDGIGLKHCRGIWDSNICGIRDWPQNDCGIRDSNILREWDKVRHLFSIPEIDSFYLTAREIELTPQNNIER